MERFTENSLSPSQGWVVMTCKNHSAKRWVMKDPSIRRISQNSQLMYRGDLSDGLVACPVQDESMRKPDIEASLAESGMGFECTCPFGDLVQLDEPADRILKEAS